MYTKNLENIPKIESFMGQNAQALKLNLMRVYMYIYTTTFKKISTSLIWEDKFKGQSNQILRGWQLLLGERVGPCAYILSWKEPYVHLCTVGHSLKVYQIHRDITPCEILFGSVYIFLYIFWLGIQKLQNAEDETFLPSLVKKSFDHV